MFERTLVVIPYFNFYPNAKRLTILADSLRELAGLVDVWVMTCGESLDFFDELKDQITFYRFDNPRILKCFQKESLINNAIEILLRGGCDYDRVVFMDADIHPSFGDSWGHLLECCEVYHRNELGQPCTHFLTQQGLLESFTSRISKNLGATYEDIRGTAPGGCWVVGSAALKGYRQFNYCLLGGGDSAYAMSFLTDFDDSLSFTNRMPIWFKVSIGYYLTNVKRDRSATLKSLASPFCLESIDHGTKKDYIGRHDLYNHDWVSGTFYKEDGVVCVHRSECGERLQEILGQYMSNL